MSWYRDPRSDYFEIGEANISHKRDLFGAGKAIFCQFIEELRWFRGSGGLIVNILPSKHSRDEKPRTLSDTPNLCREKKHPEQCMGPTTQRPNTAPTYPPESLAHIRVNYNYSMLY